MRRLLTNDRYLVTLGNPLGNVDPSGHSIISIAKGIVDGVKRMTDLVKQTQSKKKSTTPSWSPLKGTIFEKPLTAKNVLSRLEEIQKEDRDRKARETRKRQANREAWMEGYTGQKGSYYYISGAPATRDEYVSYRKRCSADAQRANDVPLTREEFERMNPNYCGQWGEYWYWDGRVLGGYPDYIEEETRARRRERFEIQIDGNVIPVLSFVGGVIGEIITAPISFMGEENYQSAQNDVSNFVNLIGLDPVMQQEGRKGARIGAAAIGIGIVFGEVSATLGATVTSSVGKVAEIAEINLNKLQHIFENPKHNHKLQVLLDSFEGSQIRTYQAIEQAVIQYVNV